MSASYEVGQVACEEAAALNITAAEALAPLYRLSIAFLIFMTILVCLRFYSRCVLARIPLGWDDILIVPAYLCIVGTCACTLSFVHIGTIGTPSNPVPMNLCIMYPDQLLVILEPLLKLVFTMVQMIFTAFACTRLSILILYLRIFTGRKVRIVTWVGIGVIVSAWFGVTLAGLFLCLPIQSFWDKTIPNSTCVDSSAMFRYTIIVNMILDLGVVAIPIPTIINLKISRARRLTIGLAFCVGLLGFVASALRLNAAIIYSTTVLAPSLANGLFRWNVIEPSIYLVATCLPGMHHLLLKMVPRSMHTEPDPRTSHKHQRRRSRLQNTKLDSTFVRLFDIDSHGHARTEIYKDTSMLSTQNDMENREPTAIRVTTEIIVTQEERIATLLGM